MPVQQSLGLLVVRHNPATNTPMVLHSMHTASPLTHDTHGSTNLPPLLPPPAPTGYRREIVFLTDGGITGSEESNVYNLVSTGKASISQVTTGYPTILPYRPSTPLLDKVKAAITGATRAVSADAACEPAAAAAASEPAAIAAATTIHCLGIGHGVHRSLLDGMSTRTGGVVHCVLADEDIAAKCGALRRAATTGGRLSKPRLLAKGCLAKPAPGRLPQVRARAAAVLLWPYLSTMLV